VIGLGGGGTTFEEPPRTLELEAIEAEQARRHWDAWVETKIPALGNRTPRQATKTERGRERLEALLVDYARQDFGVR
jgi:hypothetical protein